MVFVLGNYDRASPLIKRYSEDGEGSHQGIAEKSDLDSLFEMNPDMETGFGEMHINAELNFNPSISLVEKESPDGGTSYMLKSALRVEMNKEQGRESVTIYDKPVKDNIILEAENLGKDQGGDLFMATLQEIDRDLKKFVGENHGGISGMSDLCKHDLLFVSSNSGHDSIKEGKGGERDGLDVEKLIGPKLSTNPLSRECFKVDRSRPPLQDLTNMVGPFHTPRDSQGVNGLG